MTANGKADDIVSFGGQSIPLSELLHDDQTHLSPEDLLEMVKLQEGRVVSFQDAMDAVDTLLRWVGEEPERDGLVDTPMRVVKALAEMTAGYHQDPETILSRVFDDNFDQMVLLKNIRFTSLCEHHMLTFAGTAAVAYVPDGKVIGISKLARIVECFAKRLQVQERMTNQIAETIEQYLQPRGVAVLIKAHHSCMGCRGANQPNTDMLTSQITGIFKDRPTLKDEFFQLLQV